MKKKIIGVSANILKSNEKDNFMGYNKQRIFSGYLDSVIDAKGVPLVIPVIDDKDILERQLEVFDGIIISGGYDVGPEHYNEEPTILMGEVHYLRDEFEIKLIKLAMEKNIPILGICRGHQLINVVNGGSLYQDNSQCSDCFVKHTQSAIPDYATHIINIDIFSYLYKIFGEKTMVNSYHHQSIKELAKGFKVIARSSDNIIEAIEWIKDERVILGIQWHPEMMSKTSSKMLDIFKYFISRC